MLVLVQAFRLQLVYGVVMLLPEVLQVFVRPDILPHLLVHELVRQFLACADGVALADDHEAFRLLAFFLDVLAFAELLDHEVRYQGLQVILVDPLEEWYRLQEL